MRVENIILYRPNSLGRVIEAVQNTQARRSDDNGKSSPVSSRRSQDNSSETCRDRVDETRLFRDQILHSSVSVHLWRTDMDFRFETLRANRRRTLPESDRTDRQMFFQTGPD